MRILLAPGTTGIAQEVYRSLSTCKNIEILGCGFDPRRAKLFGIDNFVFAPEPRSPSELEALLITLQKTLHFDAIYICHDEWLRKVSSLSIASPIRSLIINQPSSKTSVLLSKKETLRQLRIPKITPVVYDTLQANLDFPLFVKPDEGQGSRGAKKIETRVQLSEFIDVDSGKIKKDFILCEFLPGDEFTVDCFSDIDFRLVYYLARKRNTIHKGIASETQTLQLPEIKGLVEDISLKFGLTGAWFVQFKRSKTGVLKLLEVGIRVAGASGINRSLGVNLALMHLYQFMGQKIDVISQFHPAIYFYEQNTCKINFHFGKAYFDFDDTLTVGNSFNLRVLEAIQKLKLDGIEVSIITRSKVDIAKRLETSKLNQVISRVEYLKENETKSSKIDSSQICLFVDDSFRERKEVSTKLGNSVLVLDPSAFETTLDFNY
jgi:carbamoyl-phosphate synthase large subunit